jgi:hypothetical protein
MSKALLLIIAGGIMGGVFGSMTWNLIVNKSVIYQILGWISVRLIIFVFIKYENELTG